MNKSSLMLVVGFVLAGCAELATNTSETVESNPAAQGGRAYQRVIMANCGGGAAEREMLLSPCAAFCYNLMGSFDGRELFFLKLKENIK